MAPPTAVVTETETNGDVFPSKTTKAVSSSTTRSGNIIKTTRTTITTTSKSIRSSNGNSTDSYLSNRSFKGSARLNPDIPRNGSALPQGNWKINWVHTILLTSTPMIALIGMLTTTLQWKTAIWGTIYYFMTGIGITAGYHRLWAHRSYSATLPYRIYMSLTGAGAFEGSIKWWSRGHRAHHRYTDTDDDPYSAHRGLFWSHIGWMLFKEETKPSMRKIDVSDLMKDPVVRIQHQFYPYIALTMSFIFPTLVAGLGWGDYAGGYFYAGVLRLVVVHHATFCVNSLAHYLGDQPFDDRRTPRDHILTALVTMGEGYHNFHHEFPTDYRNAIKFYQYDPTKWLIKLCSFVGLTYDLNQFPENEIQKGLLQMNEKLIEAKMRELDWGIPIERLPRWSSETFEEKVKKTPGLLKIDGFVYDVSRFAAKHPGGEKYITVNHGRDVSRQFNGTVYNHSNAARNLMSQFRIAVLDDSNSNVEGKDKEE